jgi:hypothetical protein
MSKFIISAAILAAILDFSNKKFLNQKITNVNEFLDPENLILDTKIIFLAALIRKIWQINILVAILAAILDFSKCSRVPGWHHSDSQSVWSQGPKNTKTHWGSCFFGSSPKSVFGHRTMFLFSLE